MYTLASCIGVITSSLIFGFTINNSDSKHKSYDYFNKSILLHTVRLLN